MPRKLRKGRATDGGGDHGVGAHRGVGSPLAVNAAVRLFVTGNITKCWLSLSLITSLISIITYGAAQDPNSSNTSMLSSHSTST